MQGSKNSRAYQWSALINAIDKSVTRLQISSKSSFICPKQSVWPPRLTHLIIDNMDNFLVTSGFPDSLRDLEMDREIPAHVIARGLLKSILLCSSDGSEDDQDMESDERGVESDEWMEFDEAMDPSLEIDLYDRIFSDDDM
jgi:hypothetical protein